MSDPVDSTKRLIKAGARAAVDPIGGTKDSFDVLKDDWSDATGKTKAKEREKAADAESARLREIQFAELAKLSDEENRRIKKILIGGRYGTRGYAGGPLFRQPSASARSAAPVMSGSGGSSAATGAAAMRAGGAAGGRAGYFRQLVQA